MEFLRNLSDDELALFGCFGALAVSFGLISGSYHLRRIFRERRFEADAIETSTAATASSAGSRPSKRRAA
jgi:hypothetical protein